MSKYIFIDCDGTIVPYLGSIPESTLQALSQAKINGYQLILTTGRYLDELTDDILEIGFDGFILNGGRYVQYHDHVLFDGCFSKQEIVELSNYLNSNHLQYRYQLIEGICQTESFENDFDVYEDDCISLIDQKNCIRDDVRYIYISVDDQKYQQLIQTFPNYSIYGYMNNHHYCIAELTLKGLDKGYSVELLMNQLNISKEDTISIGDDSNDISMFEKTGISICMGQGILLAQQKASYITDSISKDGIYKALKHFNVI